MANNDKRRGSAKPQEQDKPTTLKDLLGADVLEKLKRHTAELKAEEAKREEEKRIAREEARKAEQKRLDNDFEYLLNNSKQNWREFK